MNVAHLLLGILLIYFMPGAACGLCLLGKKKEIWLAAPFFSAIGMGLAYGVPGLIIPRAMTPAQTVTISLSITLAALAVFVHRKQSPLLAIRSPDGIFSPRQKRLAAGLAALGIALVALAHISNLMSRLPNISDTFGRLNIVQALNLTGIPPRHWVQPTTVLFHYFYSYIPAAALVQLAPGSPVMTVWWLHVVLQAVGYGTVATFIVLRMARHATLGILSLSALFLGSSFGFLPGIADKLAHAGRGIESWLFALPGYEGVIACGQILGHAMWVPHHVLSLVVVIALPFLHWRCEASPGWKIGLSAILVGFLAGSSTFLFVPCCAGLGVWTAARALRRDWKESAYWTAIMALSMPLVLPFVRFVTRGNSEGSGLTIATHAWRLTSLSWVNQALGLTLETIFLAVQFGLASVGFGLLWRQVAREKGKDPERLFYLVTSAAIVVLLFVVASGTGRGDLNNLGFRGLLIPYAFLLMGLCCLPWPAVADCAQGWKRWLWLGLLAYGLLPSIYAFAGSMAYLTRLPAVPAVALWINRTLPMNAVIAQDENVLAQRHEELIPGFLGSVIMRQKWVPYSKTTSPERGSMDVSRARERYPHDALAGRPVYLLRLADTPKAQGAFTLYQDTEYAVDRQP